MVRSQLSTKPVDNQEVCDIYGEDQMSYRTICRWVAKFRKGQLKDAAHTARPATATTKSNIEKNPQYPTERCLNHSRAISPVNILVVRTFSCDLKEAFTT